MPQTQLLLVVLTPTLAVLVGILFKRNDYAKLDQRGGATGDKLEARIG